MNNLTGNINPQQKIVSSRSRFEIFKQKNMKFSNPLPNINDLLDQVGKANYFSAFDMKLGFYQLAIKQKHQKYTAIPKKSGHYEFRRLPMGLCNSASHFQKYMNDALGLNGSDVLVYIDDFLLFAMNLEEHKKKYLRLVKISNVN